MGNKLIQKIDSLPEVNLIEVNEGENLRLELAFFLAPPEGLLKIHCQKDSSVNIYVSDFTDSSSHLDIEVDLEEGSEAEIRLAVLAQGNAKKIFVPNVRHIKPKSKAFVSCYGIAAESSDLSFKGLSEIVQGAKLSDTRQEAKIILFDKSAKGAASPALKISENDIKAGHGASIGRLNDEHLFYLQSRGLSEREAKRLIILGYLKPIVAFYSDEQLKERINAAIEGGISHD